MAGDEVDAQGFQEHKFEISEDFAEVDILGYRVTDNGELIYDVLKLDKENDDIIEEIFSSSSLLPLKVEYDMFLTLILNRNTIQYSAHVFYCLAQYQNVC